MTLKFGVGTQLIVEGDLDAEGVTFTEVNGLGWDGIVVEGGFTADDVTVEGADVGVAVSASGTADIESSTFENNDTGLVTEGDLTLSTSTVEDGDVGVIVYEPGTATLTSSTLRDNSVVGLDVLSAAGTTVAGSTIEQNGRGVRTGIPQEGPGGPVYCFGPCRSTLAIEPSSTGGFSFIQNNVHAGVEALDADVEVRETFIWNNGDTGLRVSNATVDPFRFNCVQNNGITHDSPGTSALPGGDFYVSPSDDPGENRIADNQMAELVVLDGGYALVGDPTGNTGQNAVFDVGSSQPLITNGNKVNVDAFYTYWGTGSWPPTNAFNPTGSVDFYPHALASDPTFTRCNSLRQGPPSPGLQTASVEKGDVSLRGEGLGEAIRAIRSALAAAPASDSAAVLVERLHNLHRRDRGDGLGEWAATAALLRLLRGNLAEPEMPAPLRATAEAALEVEALHALTHGEHEEAGNLLAAWSETVESPEVSGVLRMIEAHLTAADGDYGAASSLVAAVAEGEPDEVARRELLAVAALYAERAGEPGAGRGTPYAAGNAQRREASAEAELSGDPVLSVYPNPGRGRVTVALSLAEASDVRVAVYDVLGREVTLLADGAFEAGEHRFDLDGSRLPTGVYLVRVEHGERRFAERITLVR